MCRNTEAEESFLWDRLGLPMLTANQHRAFTGLLAGNATVWRLDGTQVAPLYCRR